MMQSESPSSEAQAVIRILRWFRILRLIRFIEGKALFGNLDREDTLIITRIVFTIFSIIFIYSGLIYQVEHPVNILTQPTVQELLVAKQKDIMPLGGGAGGSPQDIAMLNLELQGFENIKPIEGGGAPVLSPASITGLDGASSYTIIPLDATQTTEFQDFVYVAIEQGTNSLLEVARLSDALQIYNDQEMNQRLQELFPGKPFEIESGYFWKPCFELRSRLAVARRFKLEGESMFLLPDGNVVKSLTDFTKGG